MVSCLQLGAADYMLKPLRNNELRNLWARVYWWRRVGPSPPANVLAREECSQCLKILNAFLSHLVSPAGVLPAAAPFGLCNAPSSSLSCPVSGLWRQ